MQLDQKKLYFISEIGVNHEGSIDKAKEMIDQVSDANGHAVKFQTYKANTIAAKNSPAYWDQTKEPTSSQYELFRKYDSFEKEDYIELAKYCKLKGVDFLSTPFDLDCLSWLVPLMSCVKIASADLTNYLLLEAIAEYGKPIILSVGACSNREISEVLEFLEKFSLPHIFLLHCMLLYPTKVNDAHLANITRLKERFARPNISIGYSDHVAPDTAQNDQLVCAYGLGARVIEKHFTLDKSLEGNDHYHSLDYSDLKSVIKRLSDLESLLGDSFDEKYLLEKQFLARKNARRSLYYGSSFRKGHKIEKGNIIAKRPGEGLSPKDYGLLIGKILIADVFEDQLIKLSHFEKKL